MIEIINNELNDENLEENTEETDYIEEENEETSINKIDEDTEKMYEIILNALESKKCENMGSSVK